MTKQRRPAHRRSRWASLVLAAALAPALGAACNLGETPAPPQLTLKCPAPMASIALVVGARANTAVPSLPAELVERLGSTVRAGQRVSVIRLDGDPQPVFDQTPKFTSQNGPALDDEVGGVINQVSAAIAGPAHAVVPEADVLTALSLASRKTGPQGTVVVLDSGLQTVAPLDFRRGDLLLADPGETVDHLRKQDLVPDLAGRSLIFIGLGETAKPQAGLDDHLRRNLAAIWRAIGEAGGACVDEITPGSAEVAVTGVPAVSLVTLPEPPPPPPVCGDSVLSEQNDAGFEKNSTTFRNERAARAAIGAIVAMANKDQRLEIVGTTARWGPRDQQIELSQRRAETVRDVMVELGVDRGRITTSGEGSYYEFYIPDGGPDNLDPGPAAQNRRVIVRLICER